MSYVYQATEEFWKNFYVLPPEQKVSAREAWAIFKVNPFDTRLGTHKIHSLSALYRVTIWASVIEGDLRVIFRIDSDRVTTLAIGSHKIYRT